jgi:hypothetical protein
MYSLCTSIGILLWIKLLLLFIIKHSKQTCSTDILRFPTVNQFFLFLQSKIARKFIVWNDRFSKYMPLKIQSGGPPILTRWNIATCPRLLMNFRLRRAELVSLADSISVFDKTPENVGMSCYALSSSNSIEFLASFLSPSIG